MLGVKGRPVEMSSYIGKDEERTDDGIEEEHTTAYLYFLRDDNAPYWQTFKASRRVLAGRTRTHGLRIPDMVTVQN